MCARLRRSTGWRLAMARGAAASSCIPAPLRAWPPQEKAWLHTLGVPSVAVGGRGCCSAAAAQLCSRHMPRCQVLRRRRYTDLGAPGVGNPRRK